MSFALDVARCGLVGKIFGEPKFVVAINVDVDADHCVMGAEDVFAVPIVGGLLGHHAVVQPERASAVRLRGPANVFTTPGPLNAVVGNAVTDGWLAWELMGHGVGGGHFEVMLMRAIDQQGVPFQGRDASSGARVIDSLEDIVGNLLLVSADWRRRRCRFAWWLGGSGRRG
jgi:hypothetical protein